MNAKEAVKKHGPGAEFISLQQCGSAYDPAKDDDVVTAAEKRIADVRMRDVELRLVDANGKPLSGVAVEVCQQTHAFPFGDVHGLPVRTCMCIEEDGSKGAEYRRHLARLLNACTSTCYWTEREGSSIGKIEERQGMWDLEPFAQVVNWTLSKGLVAKGHPLFWTVDKAVPQWLRRYDVETQMKFLEVRIRNIVSRFKGRVTIWDAINEACWEPSLRNLPDRLWPHIETIENIAGYIAPVIRWAREEDPDAAYVVNDYGMQRDDKKEGLKGNDGSTVTAASQRKRFLELVRVMGGQGAAPDAIGLQSRSGWTYPSHQVEVYDEFATSGLPIHVTEFTIPTDTLEADDRYSPEDIQELVSLYARRYMTCAFGHPAIDGFFFWGFVSSCLRWRDRHRSHDTVVCRAYDEVRKLIWEDWITREALTTDDNGVVQFRGYFGDYVVRYTDPAGQPKGERFSVAREDGMPLTVTARPSVGPS